MRVCFVSGVDTNVGKTYITHHIIRSLQDRGIRALAIKPIETGVQGEPQDSSLHLQDARKILPSLSLRDINLYAFAPACAPSVADKEGEIQPQAIIDRIRGFEGSCEVLLVEGAGGLFCPITQEYWMSSLALDLQREFEAKTLLVCDDNLGMIHRFLSAKFIADSLQLDTLFFVNIAHPKRFDHINLPFMQAYAFETEIGSLCEQILEG